ncbi:MAG: 2-hexaprenyl-6-methoxy-1,4-benzoquinone methyltransferase [Chrysothrix sp. TS-e1954]|nr:MAG: 2-hexaprenyl-6-methoxy-1,4-benzoquinone methyltransferase [Chrysothrix sp. TS-e1954]
MDPRWTSGNFKLLSRQLKVRNVCSRSFATSSKRSQQPQKRSQDSRSNDNRSTTDFGFETVSEALKASRVGAVFSSVASSYDNMNDFMSLGVHRLWKDQFVRSLNPGAHVQVPTGEPVAGWKILDVAGGTGDIAFRMLDHATTINQDNNTCVTVADINTFMLAEGRLRSRETAYANSSRLDFIEANAEDLSTIASDSLDLYTVAFGIRNFTDKGAALREAFRVLKPGGLFACLEFSKVQNALFNNIYKRWSFGAIPLLGQIVAGDRDSYQYLVESIDKFPSQETFRNMITQAGFAVPAPGWQNLTGGIAAIHRGVKPFQ